MRLRLFICVQLVAVQFVSQAQPLCTEPGQHPNTAFPICGNIGLFQPKINSCYNGSFYVPGCTNDNTSYGDLNPVYYQFTCKTAGSLGFTIFPDKANDDYNWQLFDITGRTPSDIFKDRTLTLTGNWSGSLGPTGARTSGLSYIQCRTFNPEVYTSTYTAMPELKSGHTYLLMVSNAEYAGNFSISFGGGTADISSDPGQQVQVQAQGCNNNELLLVFNKKVKCSSITGNGSEFSLIPSGTIASVIPVNCSNTAETDSIRLLFSQPLPSGTYQLQFKNGTDGNTIIDRCNNPVPVGTNLSVQLLPYVIIDRVDHNGCEPSELTITLSGNVQCNSIAPNGSDFVISGPSLVSITNASFVCTNNETKEIKLTLQQRIKVGGNYSIALQNGTDGNTLMDACNHLSPFLPGADFNIKNSVDAAFTYTIQKGCEADTVVYSHSGANEVNSWLWVFPAGTSTLQQPTVIYATGGVQVATLSVSNGQCAATTQDGILLPRKLKVDFEAPSTLCAGETAVFINNTNASAQWLWDFGNGNTSTENNPPKQSYPVSGFDKDYTVILTATNNNCTVKATKTIAVINRCSILLPNAFTPNGDGLNDFFGPPSINGTHQFTFRIYNKYGQTVFVSHSPSRKWDGMWNAVTQQTGLYLWTLTYHERTSGKNISRSGTVTLLR